MIKIAICDDDFNTQLNIKSIVENIFARENKIHKIVEYSSGEELLGDMPEAKYDIVLLDIDMPTMDGIEVADKVTDIWKDVNIVFVTNRKDLVFEALNCNPFRFVRKEYLEEGIDEAITALITKIYNETYVVSFGDKKEQYSFRINDLLYLESERHYVFFHLDNGQSYKIRTKLGLCEEKLKPYGFIKTHISILVNVRKIRRITSKEVLLINGVKVPVSRSNSDIIKLRFSEEMGRHVNGINI